MSSSPPDIDRGTAMQAITWSTTAVAWLFLVLRFWARLYKRALAIDDGFMLLSWLLFLACTIVFNFMATTGGTRHMQYLTPTEIEYQLKLILIAFPLAIGVTTFGKMAIGVTILRIIGNTSQRKRLSVWAMLMVMITTSIVDIFLGLFQCGSPRNQWDLTRAATAKCFPIELRSNFNYFTIGVQTFSDYFFSVLPMVVVWKLHMKLRRKFTIMFLLGLTLVTGAVGTAKLVNQVHLSTDDMTGSAYLVTLLFSLEVMFIIAFGSVPVLNPLWDQCTEIRHSKIVSKLAGSSKLFSRGSSANQTTGQIPHAMATPNDSKWLPDANTELARLTGHLEQPAVVYHGPGRVYGYPEQYTVPVYSNGQFVGYATQFAVPYQGNGDVVGYAPDPALIHGHPGALQDEMQTYDQRAGDISVQRQAYQCEPPQEIMNRYAY